jgi:hypothetical protein
MMIVLLLIALIVLLAVVFKSYVQQPKVLELRELTQQKAQPGEAFRLIRR